MSSKMIKIIVGSLLGLLSLTTTVSAGYKVYKNSQVSAEKLEAQPTVAPTPQVVEVIENVEEVVTITPSPLPKTTTQISASAKPMIFDDDDDDEVEFEDEDDEKEDEHKNESDDEKDN